MLFTLETERESSVKGFTELIVNSVRGFCMALADSVPGVSGGTVAFLLGFYDRFIGSLDDLFHGARAARSTSSTRPNARRPSLGSAAATARANASVFPVRLSYTIA